MLKSLCPPTRSSNGCPHPSASRCRKPAGPELRNWLREQEAAAGDSLLVQITDADRSRCRVRLERRSERDNEQILRRNQELAEAAARVLRDSLRGSPLAPTNLAGWLLG